MKEDLRIPKRREKEIVLSGDMGTVSILDYHCKTSNAQNISIPTKKVSKTNEAGKRPTQKETSNSFLLFAFGCHSKKLS
jgi:hypothetical protein